MIIEAVFNLITSVLYGLFDLLPDIPQFEGLQTSINNVIDIVFGYLDLLGIFIRPTTIHIIVPIFLVVYNFDHIYKFVMFIIRKLPININ